MKLVRFGRNGAWELYDMKADRTEQHDLAAKNPDRVREMSAHYDAWAQRAGARPWPANPGAGKKQKQAANDE